MSNFATVQKVLDVKNHPNADKLDIISVLGWNVIAKRNEFKIGDLCIYIQIDTVAPDKPEFAFLADRKFRIKTIRLRGELSQGIIFPLNMFPIVNCYEGQDITDILGVVKYEKPVSAQLAGEAKGGFPSYVPKTDEPRIQNNPKAIEEFTGKEVYISCKMDGTSATYIHKDGEINVCSRTLSRKESDSNVYWNIFKKYNIENILRATGNIAIQGEICGPKIQANPIKLTENKLFVFNVFNIDKQKYYDFDEFTQFCKIWILETVPIEEVKIFNFKSIDELLVRAKGLYDSGVHKEGIVIRTTEELYSPTLHGRSSFKVINNDFLEKVEE